MNPPLVILSVWGLFHTNQHCKCVCPRSCFFSSRSARRPRDRIHSYKSKFPAKTPNTAYIAYLVGLRDYKTNYMSQRLSSWCVRMRRRRARVAPTYQMRTSSSSFAPVCLCCFPNSTTLSASRPFA